MRRITLEAEFICNKYKPWSHKSKSRLENGDCHLCNLTNVVVYEFMCYELAMPSIHCCLKCDGLRHMLGAVGRDAFLLETTLIDQDLQVQKKAFGHRKPQRRSWPELTTSDKALIAKAEDMNSLIHAKIYDKKSWRIIPDILKQYKEKGILSPKQMAVVTKYVNSSR